MLEEDPSSSNRVRPDVVVTSPKIIDPPFDALNRSHSSETAPPISSTEDMSTVPLFLAATVKMR